MEILHSLSSASPQEKYNLNPIEPSPFLIILSQFCGVSYTIAWTFGAYPQVYRNWKNKKVYGLSLDSMYYGLLGFIFFLCFTLIQYIQQFVDGAAEAVKLIDLLYAFHAMLLISILCAQFVIYKEAPLKFGTSFKIIISCVLFFTFIIFILAATSMIPWLITITKLETKKGKLNFYEQFIYSFSFIQFLGYINTSLTVVKYVPQVHLNYVRKKTSGFSIWFIFADFFGGIMSFFQNTINSINYQDLEFLTGNLPKLAVALISLVFDIIILAQFWLYRKNNKVQEKLGGEDAPLL